ncbi:MAG: Rne/Rng family ribonuclease [Candidatus Omnitrophota bacterium]
MPKEILINVEPQQVQVAVTKDGRFEEFYLEQPQYKTIVGNIYKGKVESVHPEIGAAFVNIGLIKNGFLYLSEAPLDLESLEPVKERKPLEFKVGQEILVQVTKEPYGTKGPRLTTNISIAARNLVIMPQDTTSGISRRIDDSIERKRLLGLLHELHLPKDKGFIIRTAAYGATKKDLIRDFRFLIKLWSRIERLAKRSRAPMLIYEEYDLILRIIRDCFSDDVTRLLIDSREEFKRVVNFMKSFFREAIRRIEFYNKDLPLFNYKNLECEIPKIYEKKVYLKSGAYLVIEQTEGLAVIDVNSGKFKKKLNQENMAYSVNLEAVPEIVRQIKLRDLGGIIVIDFIDMEKFFHRQDILKKLKQVFREDRAKTDILEISKFGLVQMTRERVHRTPESLFFQDCPHCQGSGKIKSIVSICVSAIQSLKKQIKDIAKRDVFISLNPQVSEVFFKENRAYLANIERKYRKKIFISSDISLSLDQVKIT